MSIQHLFSTEGTICGGGNTQQMAQYSVKQTMLKGQVAEQGQFSKLGPRKKYVFCLWVNHGFPVETQRHLRQVYVCVWWRCSVSQDGAQFQTVTAPVGLDMNAAGVEGPDSGKPRVKTRDLSAALQLSLWAAQSTVRNCSRVRCNRLFVWVTGETPGGSPIREQWTSGNGSWLYNGVNARHRSVHRHNF